MNCLTEIFLSSDILNEDDKTADSVAAPVNDAPIRMDHLDEMSVGGDHGRYFMNLKCVIYLLDYCVSSSKERHCFL